MTAQGTDKKAKPAKRPAINIASKASGKLSHGCQLKVLKTAGKRMVNTVKAGRMKGIDMFCTSPCPPKL